MWTEKKLKQLVKEGKIRGYRITAASKRYYRNQFLQKKGKQKYWIELTLNDWCERKGLRVVPEYVFSTKRKFRFDWAIPDKRIAIEYEGIFSEKSRHTTVQGYSRDSEKYNLAVENGWRVLRYTAMNYKNLLNDLNAL